MSSSYADDCSSPLGVQNRKQIPDNKLMALSTFQDDFKQFGPQRGRLHSSSAYRADPRLVSGAFIIVLPQEKIVTAVATQGFRDEWVTKYRLVFYPGDGGPSTITEVRSSEVHLFTFNENRVDHVVIFQLVQLRCILSYGATLSRGVSSTPLSPLFSYWCKIPSTNEWKFVIMLYILNLYDQFWIAEIFLFLYIYFKKINFRFFKAIWTATLSGLT